MNIPITQSKEWQNLQNDLNETSFYKENDEYQFLAILKKTPVGNYLFLPYGPVAAKPKSMQKALEEIDTLARQHQCIFIRIEPQLPQPEEYLPKTAKKVKDISPLDTWILDLSPDENTLISNFSQGTRTCYHNVPKRGLKVETTKDKEAIKHLVSLQNQIFKKKHLTGYDKKYLETELEQPFATLYLVKYYHPNIDTKPENTSTTEASISSDPEPKEGQILAASLFFDFSDTRYYMQSASDQNYRKLPATVALLTAAIFDAKKKGIKYFDFWGIAPEDAPKNHPWYGFTKFKKSFGGESKHYAGTYDIVIKPLKYRLFEKTHQLKKLLH